MSLFSRQHHHRARIRRGDRERVACQRESGGVREHGKGRAFLIADRVHARHQRGHDRPELDLHARNFVLAAEGIASDIARQLTVRAKIDGRLPRGISWTGSGAKRNQPPLADNIRGCATRAGRQRHRHEEDRSDL